MPEFSSGESLPLESLKPDFQIHYSYPVLFTRNVFDPENLILAGCLGLPADEQYPSELSRVESEADLEFQPSRVLVILDQGLLDANPGVDGRISNYLDSFRPYVQFSGMEILAGGEACKNDLSNLTKIYEAVARYGIDRHSCILAVGGGALIDVAGFAAATAHRGIRLIRIPTTVLAQNDASIGVKNGMNFAGRKNFIGSFASPFAVINDFEILRTLSQRDKRAGMAEAIKVALIRDPGFFQWMEAHAGQLARFETWALEHLIVRCAELHLHQISQGGDPFESGSARPLDFGHWSAHKLEELSNHELRHGEAVALGMALDSVYSHQAGLLNEKQLLRVLSLLENLGFSLHVPWSVDVDQSLEEFREHLGGELCITLLEDCGVGVEVNRIDADLMRESMAWLEKRFSGFDDVEHTPSSSHAPPRSESRQQTTAENVT
ncbi:MAG: 3-dehydroquinate synthase [Spirochaetaceae bacterium]|nr:3-dehydroquinate synthase [Spirochaetaceae bacterium]